MNDASPSILVNSLSPESEADLIGRVKAGDQDACAKLVALFTPRMMAVARRFLHCDDDCHDALQDAYVSAFRAISGFEGGARLSTWLHRITVNCCLMRLRSSTSRNETPIGDLHPGFSNNASRLNRTTEKDPSTDAEMDEARQILRRAIDRLPDPYREVLMLRDIEQMDTADTAARLNITAHNVKRRLRLARHSLCVLLGPMMLGEIVLSSLGQ
jgi:RNA polymerase sigma-70 factor, ECF subfamily